MNVQRTIFASAGIALLFATGLFAQQVKTDYDRGTDFSHYKTYSWEKVQTADPLWVGRIKEAVNSALTAKGLTPVESGGDVAIVAIEMTKNQQSLNTFYDGFGGGWRWGGGFANATTTVDNYKVGTLTSKTLTAARRVFRLTSERVNSPVELTDGGRRPSSPQPACASSESLSRLRLVDLYLTGRQCVRNRPPSRIS